MFTLTQEEVQQFSERIRLPEKKDTQSKYEYLNEIIHSFQENIPFQNVFLLATPVEKRRRLTWDEVKSDMLKGEGGLCYSLNLFFHIYLKHLGYNTDLVLSTYGSPNDHSVIIINALEKETDKFMIDVGAGYASFVAIPLDFEIESPFYSFSYTTVKLKWDETKQNILRVHKSSSSGQEKVILKFNFKPIKDYYVELSEQERIFTDPTFTPFHKILCILTFNRDGARNMQDKQFVRENLETHKLENQGEVLKDSDSFAQVCKKEFPTVNYEHCKQAYDFLFREKQ